MAGFFVVLVCFRSAVGSFWLVLARFACFCSCWVVLGCFDWFWVVLAGFRSPFGLFWIVLAWFRSPFGFTAPKMKFSIKGFFSKCDQIHRKIWIWSHLLKKSLIENFIFCTAFVLGCFGSFWVVLDRFGLL